MTSSCSHWHSLHFYSFSSLRLVAPPYSQLRVIATDRRLGSCLLSYSTGLFVCLFVCLYTGISRVSYCPLYGVIQNDCRGFYQLVIHNTLEIGVYVFFYLIEQLQVFVTYLTGALYVHSL